MSLIPLLITPHSVLYMVVFLLINLVHPLCQTQALHLRSNSNIPTTINLDDFIIELDKMNYYTTDQTNNLIELNYLSPDDNYNQANQMIVIRIFYIYIILCVCCLFLRRGF